MLKIEVYCSIVLLSIFIVSMLSSCCRSDINSTYSLFSYFSLLTHRQYNSLKSIIFILIVVSLLIIGSDIWAFCLLQYENIGGGNKILGYIWITIEIALKIVLIVMLSVWAHHNSKVEEDKNRQSNDNSLI